MLSKIYFEYESTTKPLLFYLLTGQWPTRHWLCHQRKGQSPSSLIKLTFQATEHNTHKQVRMCACTCRPRVRLPIAAHSFLPLSVPSWQWWSLADSQWPRPGAACTRRTAFSPWWTSGSQGKSRWTLQEQRNEQEITLTGKLWGQPLQLLIM